MPRLLRARADLRARAALRALPALGRRRRETGEERGAIAILMAISLVVLVVSAGLVLDFGLVRVDRHVDQSAADSATLAGLSGLKQSGSTSLSPYVGVCTAAQFLMVNDSRFAAMTPNVGWTNGAGAATASGCTDSTLRAAKCVPGNTATWAVYRWTSASGDLSVTIQSGYLLTGSTWAEDNLPAASADSDDGAQGCDQLSVLITQRRKPGLGSLATRSNLVSTIRSVGRVAPGGGKYAPALLALKRTGCTILQTGSNAGTSSIHVLGAVGSNGVTQPGTIHSDSDSTGCGNNQSIFSGRAAEGIVAYAAPLATNPLAPDPAKPGQISSVASANGVTGTVIRDSTSYVHGSSLLNGLGGTSYDVSGRDLVTRSVVDGRYLSGVRTAVSGAAGVFASAPAASGWAVLNNCSPAQSDIDGLHLTLASKLYIGCTANAGIVPNGAVSIPAGNVWFQSSVAPSANLSLPNANHVYIENANAKTDALNLGNGSGFQVNTAGNTSLLGSCTTGQSASKAIMFVKTGDIRDSGSGTILRLCRTTVIMMGGGGTTAGCLPATAGTAPTTTPCGTAGAGTGQFTQQAGSSIDWTAPDQYDVTTNSDGTPLTTSMQAAWSDVNGPEDLALWSESYGSSTSNTYNMNGGGTFNVRGVFMVPNADPFSIGGTGTFNLTNAQFVVSSIALNGSGTNIVMQVDPNSAVHVPMPVSVGLVR